MSPNKFSCKNCDTIFQGNYCPECGQSVIDFERPFRSLIVDLFGNLFAFDTRFWKTLLAVMFKPGNLTLDFVKGHRVKYMPPFRFYLFVSVLFFILLNFYSSDDSQSESDSGRKWLDIQPSETADSVIVAENTELKDGEESGSFIQDPNAEDIAFLNEHPEIFFEQFWTYISWVMFLLMPVYGLMLWLFFRKSQRYYITHFILAINQHAFTFVILTIILLLSMALPNFSAPWVGYLLLLIPVYTTIGCKILYGQKLGKIILKLFTISLIYSPVILTITVTLVIYVLAQTGINFDFHEINIFN